MNHYLSTSKVMFEHLVQTCPFFKPLYEEHTLEYEEMLPHVLMGEISHAVAQLILLKEGQENVKCCCDILEEIFENSDESIRNVISVSFLENLAFEEGVLPKLQEFLGVEMDGELQHYIKQL